MPKAPAVKRAKKAKAQTTTQTPVVKRAKKTNAQTASETPVAKAPKKAKAAKGQSALETLPTEIFHLILNNLDTHAGLAIKFVSRTIHNKTIRSNGEPVVDLKTGPRNDYSQAVCLIESHGSFRKKFQLLTCFVCGERKANSFDGFCDNMFDKCLVVRYCLVCLAKSYKGRIPPGHKVEGELVFKCCGCAQNFALADHASDGRELCKDCRKYYSGWVGSGRL